MSIKNTQFVTSGHGRQKGATLVEMLIGLALSLIVTSSMVVLMGNSMGSATRIIQMSQLTDELRNAMSMMTRDVRRANYNPNSIYCYGNADCGADGSATQSPDVFVNTDNNCITFNLDRNWDGVADTDNAGAFRLSSTRPPRLDRDVGVIEMWVGGATPACNDGPGGNWIPVTDPGFVDVTAFDVTNDGNFQGTVSSGGGTLTQVVRVIDMRIVGELTLDPDIERVVEDTIRVRNDFFL